MLKKKLLLFLLLITSISGFTQTITPQWKPVTGGLMSYFYPAKSPAGYDTLWNAQKIRSYVNNGVNPFTLAIKRYADSLHNQLLHGNNLYTGIDTFRNLGVNTDGSGNGGITFFNRNGTLSQLFFSDGVTNNSGYLGWTGDYFQAKQFAGLSFVVDNGNTRFYELNNNGLTRTLDNKKALFEGDVSVSDSTLQVNKNGYDISNKVRFRNNISVYSKAHIDSLASSKADSTRLYTAVLPTYLLKTDTTIFSRKAGANLTGWYNFVSGSGVYIGPRTGAIKRGITFDMSNSTDTAIYTRARIYTLGAPFIADSSAFIAKQGGKQASLNVGMSNRGILNLGNTGPNEIRAGLSGTGGALNIYVNNTVSTSSSSDGTLALSLSSAGLVTAATFAVTSITAGSSNTADEIMARNTSAGGVRSLGPVLSTAHGGMGKNAVTPGAIQKGGVTSTSALVDAIPNIDYASANYTVTAINATYAVTTANQILIADPTTAAFTATLPTAVGNTGKTFTFKRSVAGANVFTIATISSQTIDGITTYTLTAQYKYVTVASNGTNWIIIANN